MQFTTASIKLTKSWWLKLKLALNLVFFVGQLVVVRTVEFARHYKLLVALYLFILIQVLLLVVPLEFGQEEPELIDLSSWNEATTSWLKNYCALPTYSIPAKKTAVEAQLKATKKILETSCVVSSEFVYTNRDLLINQALLELALGHQQAFEETLAQAKRVDPNWGGWTTK